MGVRGLWLLCCALNREHTLQIAGVLSFEREVNLCRRGGLDSCDRHPTDITDLAVLKFPDIQGFEKISLVVP